MYTAKGVRESLWGWGEAVKHGYWVGHMPADPDTPVLAVHRGSRLPCHAEYLDLSRAFAALNPKLPQRIDDLGFYKATGQFTRQQLGLWYFYVGDKDTDAWGARKFRDDWQVMSPEARTLLLELEEQHPGRHVNLNDDPRGDELVAARLGVSRRTVYYDRNDAIGKMVAFLQPSRPAESAA